MKYKPLFILGFFLFVLNASGLAQTEQSALEDFFMSSGKINVVIGVVVVIFVGLVWYLLRMERRLKKLEQENN